jgi:predicted outer membrane repeat protein
MPSDLMTFVLWKQFHKLKIIKMKKITLCIMAAFMLLSIIPTQSKAGSKSDIASMSVPPAKAAEAPSSSIRLNEIKSIDKSKMSSSEKKQLRNEARAIKSNQATNSGGGIYLSLGAIIIILLILIILL